MITAVDTNVLLDILGGAEPFGPASRDRFGRCLAEGSIVACDIVWAETAAWFEAPRDVAAALDALGVRYDAVSLMAAETAGVTWQRYRSLGGPRQRLVADFLIGAHALTQAERLLTRDRGFFRRYFAELVIVDPSTDETSVEASSDG